MPAQGSDQADEWHRLGLESHVAGNLPLAQQRYQQALRLDPRHALATLNLAIVFAQSNLLNEALLTIERAVIFDPQHAMIRVNQAFMYLEAERIGEAIEAAREAVRLAPNETAAQMALATVMTTAGYAAESVQLYNAILDREPQHPAAGPNACFVMTLTEAGPQELLVQRKRWYDANRYKGESEPHRNDRNPDRRLRVGYVGGDFKSHSAAFIFGRVLLHHTEQVEMYLYSTLPVSPESDVRTKQFQTAAGERWRDIGPLSDEDAAQLIRKDKIDILVDLAGHTNGGRLALFTRKPAPVQITAWGFAHGTGCPEIDYFLADPIAVPEAERIHYAERVLDLPCIVTMEPPEDYKLKGTSLPPLRKNGYFTFGCYTRYEKLSNDCLLAFAEILMRVPDSKLEFKDHAFRRPYALRRIISLMVDRGIATERLLFSIATPHPDHMLAYQQADLCLDPWPHGGGVVCLEQLWMGCPIITRYGTQPSGRSAASVLTVTGRTDWIADGRDEFIAKSVEWADRTQDLAEARKTLRDELLNSLVVKDYPQAVEALYRQAWREWCDK